MAAFPYGIVGGMCLWGLLQLSYQIDWRYKMLNYLYAIVRRDIYRSIYFEINVSQLGKHTQYNDTLDIPKCEIDSNKIEDVYMHPP